jgi:hypothetical protein
LIGYNRPGYLFDGLQFGRSAGLVNPIIPGHRTSVRASSSGCNAVEWSATNGLKREQFEGAEE